MSLAGELVSVGSGGSSATCEISLHGMTKFDLTLSNGFTLVMSSAVSASALDLALAILPMVYMKFMCPIWGEGAISIEVTKEVSSAGELVSVGSGGSFATCERRLYSTRKQNRI